MGLKPVVRLWDAGSEQAPALSPVRVLGRRCLGADALARMLLAGSARDSRHPGRTYLVKQRVVFFKDRVVPACERECLFWCASSAHVCLCASMCWCVRCVCLSVYGMRAYASAPHKRAHTHTHCAHAHTHHITHTHARARAHTHTHTHTHLHALKQPHTHTCM